MSAAPCLRQAPFVTTSNLLCDFLSHLRFRVAHDDVIGGEQKTVGDFPLGGKGLAGAGSA